MRKKSIFCEVLLAAICLPSYAIADIIVQDDFESGSMQSFWTDKNSVSVSTAVVKNGSYSTAWVFPGVARSEDGWSEARFDLGDEYPELTITFDLYIPTNYTHRSTSDSDNNKFFRLWNTDYDDREKIGASTLPQSSSGDSRIGSDYRVEASWGMSTAVKSTNNFITDLDKGKWMSVEIYIKAATDNLPAELRISKNGIPFLMDTIQNNHVPGTQGYRYGYLLGWANSGYSTETIFYIDNVKFYDENLSATVPYPVTELLTKPAAPSN